MSDIEGKVERVATSERGQRVSFKPGGWNKESRNAGNFVQLVPSSGVLGRWMLAAAMAE
jgi:hypothetical protein